MTGLRVDLILASRTSEVDGITVLLILIGMMNVFFSIFKNYLSAEHFFLTDVQNKPGQAMILYSF